MLGECHAFRIFFFFLLSLQVSLESPPAGGRGGGFTQPDPAEGPGASSPFLRLLHRLQTRHANTKSKLFERDLVFPGRALKYHASRSAPMLFVLYLYF